MIPAPEETHVKPPRDSRGRVLTPAGMPWARDGRPPLVLAPSVNPCPTLAPTGTCACCGMADAEIWVRWTPPAPPSSELDLSGLKALVEGYLLCADKRACYNRRAHREAVERTQVTGPALAPKALIVPASKPRSRPRRSSQAHKTLLGQAAAEAAPQTPAGLPADSAPGSSAVQPPAGGAA